MGQHEHISRRCLPHWFVPGAAHFLTYRLHGTLPREVRERLKAKHEMLLRQGPPAGTAPATHRNRVHKQLFAEYDSCLDREVGVQWLSDPRVAAVIRSNLYHHHPAKYHLVAYCVMPNHVHVLLLPRGTTGPGADEFVVGEASDKDSPLASIMHSLKSYTAHEANKLLGRTGPFWQGESYDHWVRDEDELERIVDYIGANPVRAGLVRAPHEWYFCSCHDRFLQDGEVCGWLRWE